MGVWNDDVSSVTVPEPISVNASGSGARVQFGSSRQCLRVDVFSDGSQFAISNGNVENPMVLERLIRGFDSPSSETDHHNSVCGSKRPSLGRQRLGRPAAPRRN